MTVATKSKETPGAQAGAPYDAVTSLPFGFELASGERLSAPELRLRLYGPADAPVVAVAGGISSGRDVADTDRSRGWWRNVVKAGGAVSLGAFRVLSFDFLPNPGEHAGTVRTADQARALAHGLDALELERLHGFVGASYGGMVALAFAEMFPDRLDRLCVISAADRPHPAATAMRGVQRRILNFAESAGRAEDGVALARQLAMISYRSTEEFAARFKSEPKDSAAGGPYDVCEYLISRGEKYRQAMSLERFRTLSDSIDRHRIDPKLITTPSLFVAADTDRISPIEQIRDLAAAVAGPSRFTPIETVFGHDAFLCDVDKFANVLKTFLEES